jgi:hypothetical protein
VPLAYVHCRDDLEGVRFAHNHLTSDEAHRIANGIARLPEFMMQRKDFHQRGSGQYRWRNARPYHVALEDSYIRAHWGFIDALCKMIVSRLTGQASTSNATTHGASTSSLFS